MKHAYGRLALTAVLFSVLLLAPSFARAQDAAKVRIVVKGMTCAGCEKMVEFALGRLEAIETATADFKKGLAEITLKEGKSVNLSDLRKAVIDTRVFKPGDITVATDINGRLEGGGKKEKVEDRKE